MVSTTLRRSWLSLMLGLAIGSVLASDAFAVESVLAPHKTERALSEFIFEQPARCIDLTAESRVCLWQIGNRYTAWRPLANSIGTTDRINVICTLPKGEGERAEGSCSGYPQRSNRDRFKVAQRIRGKGKRGSRSTAETAQKRKEKSQAAHTALNAARDLDALIALTGTLPTRCVGEVGGDRSCAWELSNSTLGHGTIATAGGFPLGDRVRLVCPIDAANALRTECQPRPW